MFVMAILVLVDDLVPAAEDFIRTNKQGIVASLRGEKNQGLDSRAKGIATMDFTFHNRIARASLAKGRRGAMFAPMHVHL
jgi:hypothetical protein